MGRRGYTSPIVRCGRTGEVGCLLFVGGSLGGSVDDFGNQTAVLNEGVVVERL